MKVVSNAPPLIALSLIEKLYLLEELWEEIIIPEAVYYEVVIQGKRKPGASLIEKAVENRWIRVLQIKKENAVKFLLPILDYGEAEAIVLAQEIQAGLVILDNIESRLFAHQVGLKVIGTIGVILKAYEKKLIKHPLEEIYKLKSYGFYVGDNLLKYIKFLLQERKL